MSESTRPRHIRDIAHLYLSRVQSSVPATHGRIVLCGESRDCLPAVHAANIAAAFALGGARSDPPLEVRLFDVSGLLPNAGYFFGLPPQVYLRRQTMEDGETHPALAGVTVVFTLACRAKPDSPLPRSILDVVHIPPLERRERFYASLAELRKQPVENTLFVLLQAANSAAAGLREEVSPRLRNAPCYNIGVEWTGDGWFPERIGTVTGWKSSATDRIPAVCRDPHSILAGRYYSLVDGLAFKMRLNARRKVNRAPAPSGPAAGLQSG
ncbi:MAG: hypothetical protein HY770_02405 [Chitinivibrionia bacterium]|nr:hypothetical protein [Chitinivibrionia bacterium]